MSLTELVTAMQQKATRLREKESELLSDIVQITDRETAEAARDLYDSAKHAYGFEGYLYQLEKLKTVLLAGIPENVALEIVDSCLDAETLIRYYRSKREGGRQ